MIKSNIFFGRLPSDETEDKSVVPLGKGLRKKCLIKKYISSRDKGSVIWS